MLDLPDDLNARVPDRAQRDAVHRAVRADFARKLREIVEPEELSVLMVVDDAQVETAVRDALGAIAEFKTQVSHVRSLDAARKALDLARFDVVIASFVVGDACGPELFRDIEGLVLDSATIALVATPSADVTAHSFSCGAMGVMAFDELGPSLLARTLVQTLLRREAQASLIERALAYRCGMPDSDA